MRDSHTTLRIKKLHAEGRTDEQIARSIGRPDDLERVRKVTGTVVICTADLNHIEVDDDEHKER